MNVQDLQTALRDRADGLDGSRPERLDELFGRIRARRRRRVTAAIASVTAAVLMAVGTAALVRSSDQAAPPVGPPKPTHLVRTTQQPVRPVVYVEGTPLLEYFHRQGRGPNGWREATLYYGDRAVDPAVPFSFADSTDEGLVLGGEDGRIRFWSAASSTLRQIGTLGFRPHTYRASGLVRSDTAGSLVAWFDSTAASAPELVVYDTERQLVVVRHREPPCQELCTVEALVGDHVYWSDHAISYGDSQLDHLRRFDLGSRSDTESGRTPYEADLRRGPRALVLTSRSDAGGELVTPGPGLGLVVAHGRLTVASDGNRPPLLGSPEVRYDEARDATTGVLVAPKVPAQYRDGLLFRLVQWLDDDRFAVMGGFRSHVLACSIAAQTCDLVAGGRPERAALGLPLNF